MTNYTATTKQGMDITVTTSIEVEYFMFAAAPATGGFTFAVSRTMAGAIKAGRRYATIGMEYEVVKAELALDQQGKYTSASQIAKVRGILA